MDENPAAFNAVKFHPDGHVMALAGQDGAVKLWNLCDDSLLDNIKAHENSVTCLGFSENGYYFASGSNEEVKVWDLRN